MPKRQEKAINMYDKVWLEYNNLTQEDIDSLIDGFKQSLDSCQKNNYVFIAEESELRFLAPLFIRPDVSWVEINHWHTNRYEITVKFNNLHVPTC